MSATPVFALSCCVCACGQWMLLAAAGRQRNCAPAKTGSLFSAPLQKREHSSAAAGIPEQRIQAPHTTHTPLGNAPVRGRVRRHGTPARRTAICSRRGLAGLRDGRPVGFCQRAGSSSSGVERRRTPDWCPPPLLASWWRAKLRLPVAPTSAILFRCRQHRWPAAWLAVAAPAVGLGSLALHGGAGARTTHTANQR